MTPKLYLLIMFALVQMMDMKCTKGKTSSQSLVTNAESNIRKYPVKHLTKEVADQTIFYREAGDPNSETILMLHGFPSSSHMFRTIIDSLSDRYHIIAPDYPGFGLSSIPNKEEFEYSFDNLTNIIEEFINQLALGEYYLMMQDYGGPVGFRIAAKHPEQIKGLIIQNANAYIEGFGEISQSIGDYVAKKQFEELSVLKEYLMSKEGIKSQYTNGAKEPDKIDPISYLTDNAFFDRTSVRDVQSILFDNYASNIPKYSEWQSYFKVHQPPTLILWGEHDKFFSKSGGEAYSNDLRDVEIHFFDGGHFMLEEYPSEASSLIEEFLNQHQ